MSPAVEKTNFSAVMATVAVLYFLVLMEACGCCATRAYGRFFQTDGARNRKVIEVTYYTYIYVCMYISVFSQVTSLMLIWGQLRIRLYCKLSLSC